MSTAETQEPTAADSEVGDGGFQAGGSGIGPLQGARAAFIADLLAAEAAEYEDSDEEDFLPIFESNFFTDRAGVNPVEVALDDPVNEHLLSRDDEEDFLPTFESNTETDRAGVNPVEVALDDPVKEHLLSRERSGGRAGGRAGSGGGGRAGGRAGGREAAEAAAAGGALAAREAEAAAALAAALAAARAAARAAALAAARAAVRAADYGSIVLLLFEISIRRFALLITSVLVARQRSLARAARGFG